MPINEDGTVFIGERTNPEYGGFLNAVAGHLTYKQDVNSINIPEEAYRELKEEFGIDRDEVKSLELAGVYSHPIKGDLDFTFIAKIAKQDGYFSSDQWMANVKEREHKPLVRLASMAEVGELLETGKIPNSDRTLKVMYSTRGALESLLKGELRD